MACTEESTQKKENDMGKKLEKTIGESIDDLAREYIQIYESLKNNPIDGVSPNIARNDLWFMRYKADEALKRLDEHINKDTQS